MNFPPRAKLSLAAQFDDLCRSTCDCIACFSSSTDQLVALMQNIRFLQQTVITLKQQNCQLIESNKQLQDEITLCRKKNYNLKCTLDKESANVRRLRSGLETSQSTLHKICKLTCSAGHQDESNMNKIIETLKSGFLPKIDNGVDTTDDSLSDIDYDVTPDPYSPVSSRMASHSNLPLASHSSAEPAAPAVNPLKSSENNRATFTIHSPTKLPVFESRKTEDASSKTSPSSDYFSGDTPASSSDSTKPQHYETKSTLKSYPSNASVVSNPISLVDELESKRHDFALKPLLTSETCSGCLKRISFLSSFKRCKVCEAPAHPDCADRVPLPCLKRVKSAKKKNCLSIADLTPLDRPCVPPLIIHCVIELERRRDLSHEPVYTSTIPTMVPKLVRDFIEGKRNLQFSTVPASTLAAAIKVFLSTLDEPLISFTFWRDFAATLELNTKQERSTSLWSLLMKLPGPNLDTIAYLMRHIHYMLAHNYCSMNNLIEAFVSPFIGYPSKQPTKSEIYQIQKSKIQIRLMNSLINDIDKVFWDKCLETLVPARGDTQVKVDKWPIRSSTLILNNGARRVSIIAEGICENGRLDPASDRPFR